MAFLPGEFHVGLQHLQSVDDKWDGVFFGSITMSTMRALLLGTELQSYRYILPFCFYIRIILKMMLAAPASPITAISAVSHAITWSAPKSWGTHCQYEPPYALRVTTVILGTVASEYAYSIFAP